MGPIRSRQRQGYDTSSSLERMVGSLYEKESLAAEGGPGHEMVGCALQEQRKAFALWIHPYSEYGEAR